MARALVAAGFTLATHPNGSFQATRGSLGRTLMLGAMAGKKFHVTFTVEFFTAADGNLVARLNRDLAGGALKGGVLGANVTNNAFIDTATKLTDALTSAGVLQSSLSQG